MMTVVFPAGETLDPDRDVVCFFADVDTRAIPCAVSREALEDLVEADDIDPLRIFCANRHTIEAIAERLINFKRFEHDDSILVRSADM